MASNSFGNLWRITTWGESHGSTMGVVIDGCPAGLAISKAEIDAELAKRAPGKNAYTSPRRETDRCEILSGIWNGQTTGTPIAILIPNHDVDSSKYEPMKDLLRPGHANYTYQAKYGIFDYRGSGRASARETVCRVAAGAIAKKFLYHHNIQIAAYLSRIAHLQANIERGQPFAKFYESIQQSPLFCPDQLITQQMMKLIETTQAQGDSLGGIVEFITNDLPVGLGDPIYEKMEANLAKAMLSLPATKGFEIGEGFSVVNLRGSEHNDSFVQQNTQVKTATNHAGGTLAGITHGMPLVGRVALKPTASIQREQTTLDQQGNTKTFALPSGSRHDPCVAIRAVPVIEAMLALVLADAILMNKVVRL